MKFQPLLFGAALSAMLIAACGREEIPKAQALATAASGSTLAHGTLSVQESASGANAINASPAASATTAANPSLEQKDLGAEPESGPAPSMADLFAPPKIAEPEAKPEPDPVPVVEVKPAPVIEEQKQAKPLPQLRLIGFAYMDAPQVLLSVDGTLKVLTVGAGPNELEIVEIQAPTITLKHGAEGEPFQLDLYKQPWLNPVSLHGDRSRDSKPSLPRSRSAADAAPSHATPTAAPLPPFNESFPAPPTAVGTSALPVLPGPPGNDASAMAGIPGLPIESSPPASSTKGAKKDSKRNDSKSRSEMAPPPLAPVPGGIGLPSAPGFGITSP